MDEDAVSGAPDALSWLMRLLLAVTVAAVVALALSQATGWTRFAGLLAGVGVGVLILLASFAAGAFLGFLFGVPRAVAQAAEPTATAPASSVPVPAPAPVAGSAGDAATERRRVRLLQSNTNLERISDWLTTLLVGAGLTQLHNVNGALLMFRGFLAETALVTVDAAGRPSAGLLPAIGPVLLVLGAVTGFLFMYLCTRLVLVRLFEAIERMLSDEVLPTGVSRAVRSLARADGATSFVGAVADRSKVKVEDAIGLMFDLLYRGDPQKVVDLAGQISGTAARQRADYWFYSAAAFGQIMKRHAPGSSEWTSARDNALDCARRAVAIDGSYRARLWAISDEKSYDNDLSALRANHDFERLVGR